MKTNFLTLAAAVLVAALSFSACEQQNPAGSTPSVSISAINNVFEDGSAQAILSLSAAATEDVSVSLELTGDNASAVTYPATVTIPAKSTKATVDLTANTAGLAEGSYELTLSIASAKGATVGSNKAVALTLNVAAAAEDSAIVSFKEVEIEAENNKATLTLNLSAAASADINVTLSVAAPSNEEFTAIPEAAITLEKNVVISAGSTTKTIDITIDPAQISVGTNGADITIASVSDNATIGSRKTVTVTVTKALVANLRSDWSISYVGEQNGKDVFTYNLGDSNFYLTYFAEGVVDANFKSPTELLQYVADNWVDPYIGTSDAEPSYKSGNINFPLLAFGKYDFYAYSHDAAGHLTGDYTVTSVEIVPTEASLANYEAYLGNWVIGGKTNITVSEHNRASASYAISLEDGEYIVEGGLGRAGGTLDLYPTIPANQAGDTGFFGYYPSDEEGYINLYDGSSAVASFTLTSENGGTIGAPAGDVYGMLGAALFTISGNQVTGWGPVDIEFPSTFKRPVDVASESYQKWLGSWQVDGTDTVINLVEVSKDQTVAWTGVFTYGNTSYDVPITYDSETGNLTYAFVSTGKTLNYNNTNYTVYAAGITNEGYVAMGDDDYNVATFSLTGETTASIDPIHYTNTSTGNDDWAVSIGLLGYSGGWLNINGSLVSLPATLTKAGNNAVAASSVAPSFSYVKSNEKANLVLGNKVNKFNLVKESDSRLTVLR